MARHAWLKLYEGGVLHRRASRLSSTTASLVQRGIVDLFHHVYLSVIMQIFVGIEATR